MLCGMLGCDSHPVMVFPWEYEPIPVPSPAAPAPPAGMVLVPGGTFAMGSKEFTDAQPIAGVRVSSFYLDQTEVTGEAYQACVDAKRCSFPKGGVKDRSSCNYDREKGQVVVGKEKHPMNCVTFEQAKHYCEVQGKRLPTEVEWEYAARGSVGSLYPWGNAAPDATRACWNQYLFGTCAVQGYEATLLGMEQSQLDAQRLRGIYDLGGNVYEWVDTEYANALSATNKPCDSAHSSSCVIRGGSWFSGEPVRLRSSFRAFGNPTDWTNFIGFRCARAE